LSAVTLALIILSAIMQCTWNFFSKRSDDKQAFLWLSLAAAAVFFFVPFCVFYAPLPALGWSIALVSGCVEALYYMLLGAAYQRGDLSLIYPVARGFAPLVIVVSAPALLGETVSSLGAAGVVVIAVGIYTLHLRSTARGDLLAPLTALRERQSQMALVIGVVIAAYSMLDKVGVSHVPPPLYAYLVFTVPAALLAPYMLTRRREAVKAEWGKNRRTVLLVPFLMGGAYTIVLLAMKTTQVSYVSSAREVAIVFAAIAGTLLLKEPFGRMKIAGSLLIFAGVLMIGLAR
jgi:drug/metabolite transporter (DMT)-like permease